MAVTDVWGIGRRLGQTLNTMGVDSAVKLANLNPTQVRKDFSILVENTVRELNGEIRFKWDEQRPPKKEIYSSRSFGTKIANKTDLRAALAYHTEIAIGKLRKQHSVAAGLSMFATSSPHDQAGFFRRSCFHRFPTPTCDIRNVMHQVDNAMSELYCAGIQYYRAGVGLVDLYDANQFQDDLFSPSSDNEPLMACIDQINAKFGRSTLHLATKGFADNAKMNRAFLSPHYTTSWRDIPKIQCR